MDSVGGGGKGAGHRPTILTLLSCSLRCFLGLLGFFCCLVQGSHSIYIYIYIYQRADGAEEFLSLLNARKCGAALRNRHYCTEPFLRSTYLFGMKDV